MADELVAILAPGCHRIEVAGSVRRNKETCGDIELVAIPRVTEVSRDLFGVVDRSRNELWSLLDAMSTRKEIIYQKCGDRYRKFEYREVSVDLFTAKEETWGWIFLMRTGSSDFSYRMAMSLNRHGYTSHDGAICIQHSDHVVRTPDEESVFALTDRPFVEPSLRN